MSSEGARGQDASSARMLVANVESSHRYAQELLGRPVLVSRTDVEASIARIRGGAILDEVAQPTPPLADPAFKAVLLTPRESTGRPVQIEMSPPPDAPAAIQSVALPNAASPAKAEPPIASPQPPTSSASLLPPAASPNPSDPKNVKTAPGSVPKSHGLGQGLPNPVSQSRPNPRPATTRSETASRRKATEPPTHPSYGAAEIAASRAFTRF